MANRSPFERKGVFKPKNLETLRPQMAALIGQSFTFRWAGTSRDDEPYPGQDRWMICRDDEHRLNDDQKALWSPEEDIEFAEE